MRVPALIKSYRYNIFLIVTFYASIGIFFQSCKDSDSEHAMSSVYLCPPDSISIRQYSEYRESITFILGNDKESNNPYYREAENFYRFNTKSRTEYIETQCRSLAEIVDYLKKNPPYNGEPWGVINLVTHGNQWVGMSVAVHPELKRATADKIRKSLSDGYFSEIPDSIVDSHTNIFIHGCGIGNNTDLVYAVSEIFNNNDHAPIIKASKLYEYYTSDYKGNILMESQHYFAQVYFSFYKMGYRPENKILIKDFEESYPDAMINWDETVDRDRPRWPGDAYYYTFEVPVKWTKKLTCIDSVPDLSTENSRMEWLKKQLPLVETIAQTNIPMDRFNWWIRRINYKNKKGVKLPAIWVKGYATVFCVIKPLLNSVPDSSSLPDPFIPSVYDTSFFYAVYPKDNQKHYYVLPVAELVMTAFDMAKSRLKKH